MLYSRREEIEGVVTAVILLSMAFFAPSLRREIVDGKDVDDKVLGPDGPDVGE